jgi:predicted CopG family antitoxin
VLEGRKKMKKEKRSSSTMVCPYCKEKFDKDSEICMIAALNDIKKLSMDEMIDLLSSQHFDNLDRKSVV